jgi:mannose-6-phosphate isomerase-like protein (cupin superfamily)
MAVAISLLPQFAENIKNNKITHVKNFCKFDNQYDFNFLIDYIESMDPKIRNTNKGDFFEINYQVFLESKFKDFEFCLNFLRQIFKYSWDQNDRNDIFFSFKSGAGDTHTDDEDVFIIGLNGKTIYKVFGTTTEYFEINNGDMIFIPKGIPHKVISLSSRIILSTGFYGNRSN